MKTHEHRSERARGCRAIGLPGAAIALATLATLSGCGAPEVAEPVETVGTNASGLTCVNIRRNPGSTVVEDAYLVTDPTDPTRATANYGAAITLNVGGVGAAQREALVQFDLSGIPASVTVTSASLQLSKAQSLGTGPVELHRVTGAWSEGSVTYASFGGAYDSAVLASANPAGAATTVSFDVSGVVSGWHAGSYANHGFLVAEPTNGRLTIGSSEAPTTQRPVLSVCYAPGTCADGVQNGAETGVDCGGACVPCVDPCANVVCAPLDVCHLAGSCNPGTGQCSHPLAAWGTACNDGDACTQTDTCQSGVCVGASPVSCPPGDACHAAGSCDPATGVCSNAPYADGTACDDGDACTSNDACVSGICAGSGSCAVLPPGNLTLWLDADTLGLADGAPVTTWTDQSPYGNHVTAAGAAPSFTANALNGHGSVYFDGSRWLERSVVGSNLIQSTNATAFVVLQHSSSDPYTDAFGWGDCGVNRFLVHLPYSGILYFQMGNPGESIGAYIPGGWENTFHFMDVLRAGAYGELVNDGNVLQTHNTMSQVVNTAASALLRVGNGPCNNTFTGSISELIVYGGALSAPDRAAVRSYLQAKYGL